MFGVCVRPKLGTTFVLLIIGSLAACQRPSSEAPQPAVTAARPQLTESTGSPAAGTALPTAPPARTPSTPQDGEVDLAEERDETGSEPIPVHVTMPESEPELAAWLIAQHEKVPTAVGRLGGAKRGEIAIVVGGLIFGGKVFVEKYPNSERGAAVRAIYAHALFVNRAIEEKRIADEYEQASGEKLSREERKQIADELLAHIHAVLGPGLAASPAPAHKQLLLYVRGECEHAEKRFRDAIGSLQAAIAADPAGRFAEPAAFSEILSHYSLRDYPALRRAAKRMLDTWPRSERLNQIYRTVIQTLHREGLFEEEIAFVEESRPWLEAAAFAKPMPPRGGDPGGWIVPEYARTGYRNEYCLLEAHLGLAEFGRFQRERARTLLDSFLARTDGEQLANLGWQVGDEVKITRTMIALPILTTLTALADKPAPDLSALDWVRRRPPDAPEPEAKGILLASAQSLRDRQSEFFKLLALLEQENDGLLEITWVAGGGKLKKDQTREGKKSEMLALADSAGFAGPLGFEPAEEYSTYEAFFLSPGTPSLFILDRQGRVLWHAIDPMDWDAGLLRRVVRQARAHE